MDIICYKGVFRPSPPMPNTHANAIYEIAEPRNGYFTMAQAKVAMEDDDNERADSLLIRAKADAELAIALTREESAQAQATNAVDQSNAQRSTHMEQGAQQ